MLKIISTQLKNLKTKLISLPGKIKKTIAETKNIFKTKAGFILSYLKEINWRDIWAVRAKKIHWREWLLLPRTFTFSERWLARTLSLIILLSFAGLIFNNYLIRTQTAPKIGGTYTEAIVGQPRYINPVLSQTNDTDRDLAEIVFSGLFKYDGKGELILDLAQNYEIKDDRKTYDIYLKKNVLWHDQQPLNADDVIFTIAVIQDPEYKSPLRTKWQGVEIEKIDDFGIRFKLKNAYAPFLHNLTVGIIPKHLWGGIPAADFPLAEYNLKPVGSGPYKFKKLAKDKNGRIQSIELARNEKFHLAAGIGKDQSPFIEKIVFEFYKNQEELIAELRKGDVDGANNISVTDLANLEDDINVYQINLPIYYAVFFNQTESKALSDKNVRIAFNYATNKQEIIDSALSGKGRIAESPLLTGWLENISEEKKYEFNQEKAKEILENNGWKDNDNDGVREKKINKDKEYTKLEIAILTTDWPELKQTAEIIKSQWEKIGARVNLEIINPLTIQQEYIRPRNYQAILFGEILSADPDPFAFWHSSQRKDPGLNLALYQNKDADKLLEDGRQIIDSQKRLEKYNQFQKILFDDAPAVFLYSSYYLYPINKDVKGINIEKLATPSQRFSQIENWYIKTKRIAK